MVYVTIDKLVVLSSYMHFICYWISIKFIIFGYPLMIPVSDQNIKSTTSFIGGGRSARTDYDFLKQYVVTTKVELKNPEEFSYVYCGHSTFDDTMQEIQTRGEALLVCNIPLAFIANILTSAQANEVAKKHNIHSLSRRSLVEKRTAVKSHLCTITCKKCVTVFKPVKKNQKSRQQRPKREK